MDLHLNVTPLSFFAGLTFVFVGIGLVCAGAAVSLLSNRRINDDLLALPFGVAAFWCVVLCLWSGVVTLGLYAAQTVT